VAEKLPAAKRERSTVLRVVRLAAANSAQGLELRMIDIYSPFLDQRQQFIDQTNNPVLKEHYQEEIDLVNSWNIGDIQGGGGPGEYGDIIDPGIYAAVPSIPYASDPSSFFSDFSMPDLSSFGISLPELSMPGLSFLDLFSMFDISSPEFSAPGYSLPGTSLPISSTPFVSAPIVATPSYPPGSSAPVVSSSPGTQNPNNDYSKIPDGFAQDWHTVRYSNTTNEPITVHVTMANGQPLPKGVDANGDVTIQPGQHVDLTYAPGSSFNFKSTKGDGSVWNQGEMFFDEGNHVIWGNMSYIYGSNSNMRMFSQDGQHAGYLGDVMASAPPGAKVGNWGIVAPYDRYHHTDDPNQPGSATGGPNGAQNAGGRYLYSLLGQGEGYVNRGRPAEITDYDDASSLRFTGNMVVVF
jgi:hypothetical protein